MPFGLHRAEQIARHSANWKMLGKRLGVSPTKLKEIEMNYPCNAIRSKLEVLQLWLDNDSTNESLEELLVKVVQKIALQESKLEFN